MRGIGFFAFKANIYLSFKYGYTSCTNQILYEKSQSI